MLRPGSSRLLLAGVAAALLFGGGASAQERIGVSSAVNPEASGAPPGQSARRLVIGQDVVFNERITTQEAGQTQLLFVDESSMTIGPNSDLTIDQFVYDPRTGTGKLAMTTTKGLLRFVGGKLSKQDGAVTMRTNSATLAVRGGAFLLDQSPTGALQAVFIYGHALTVTGTSGATQTLQRPGFAVTIAGPGAAPSVPFPVPPVQLAQLVSQLDGRRGATGGARTVPSEQTVAASGVDQTISGNITASVQQATAQTLAGVTPTTVNPATVQTQTSVQQAATGAVPCAAQGTCPPQTITTTPVNTQPQNVTITYAGLAKGSSTPQGFTDQSAQARIPYTGGTLTFPQGQPQNGQFSANLPGFGTVSFPLRPGINNFGPQGTSAPNGPFVGQSFLSADNTFFAANTIPSSSPSQRGFIFGGQPVNQSFFQPQPTTQITTYALGPDAVQGSPIPFTTNSFGGTQANPSVSPFFIVAPPNTQFGSFNEINNPNGSAARTLQSSLAINGSGPNQSSVLIVSTGSFASNTSGQVVQSGTVRGSFQPNGTIGNQVSLFSGTTSVPDGNGNSLFGGNTLTGFVLDQNQTNTSDNFVQALATAAPRSATSSSQNINYAFTHPAVTTSDPAVAQFGLVPYAPTTRTTQMQAGYFGGTMFPNANPNSAYVLTGVTGLQTDAANNRVGATFTGADPFTASTSGINSAVINFGTATSRPFARTAFIDDKVFAAAESPDTPSQINGAALPLPVPTQGNAPRLALVSSATVPIASGTFPGVTFCDCQFLKWGFWTGQLNQVDSSGNTTRVDRAFINSWLAGVPTSAADIASLAGANVTGSYSGHAIGSVVNNGASYLAAGNLAMTYNFASQTGSFNINNFDGRNFTATGSSALSGSNFSGGLAGNGVTGGFAGTFYGPQAANTGGTFSVRSTTATPYLASGIFAGKR